MSRRVFTALLLVPVLAGGCKAVKAAPALSKQESVEVPNVPVPPADGPKLGAIANLTPVLERPAKDAKQIGYLHAGAKVPRAAEPFSKEGCPGGWYPVRPRGFVCAGDAATTDMNHPTLTAMAMQPKLGEALPYAYARTRRETPLYDRDPGKDNTVAEIGKLPQHSGLAIIGSWSAMDPKGQMQRLGMTTDGHFVVAADLEAAEPSTFRGAELGDKVDLPVAFVVKRGVREWNVEKGDADKLGPLGYHDFLALSGRFRELDSLKYWAVEGGHYVRHRDVTVIRKRNAFPDFAKDDQKWIDISVVTGTLVAYEGRKAIFATLCSVGRDRLGDPKTTASTAQGDFDIVGKHVTAVGLDPKLLGDPFEVHDAPWAMEMSSGQLLLGAYWHDRFGIENGPGAVELSPVDAARIWAWVEPQVPDGWHGVTQPAADGKKVTVHIRK